MNLLFKISLTVLVISLLINYVLESTNNYPALQNIVEVVYLISFFVFLFILLKKAWSVQLKDKNRYNKKKWFYAINGMPMRWQGTSLITLYVTSLLLLSMAMGLNIPPVFGLLTYIILALILTTLFLIIYIKRS